MSDYQTVAAKRIPVTILTGFLGSGKTTLLNQLIEKHKNTTRFAIIENEYGETGIDGDLIGSDGMPVYELSDGCICCSRNEDFYRSLLSILENNQEINHLLVETTGVADPMSVIDLFVSNELIIRNFQIDSVICITDAGNLEDMLGMEPEARKQVALSDTILLNKMDVVRKDHAESLRRLISSINPMAKVIETSYGFTNGTPLLHTYAYSHKHVEETTLSFNSLNLGYDNINGAFDSALKRGKERRHDIFSEGFKFDECFDPEMFNIWMSSFLYFNQSTLYRVKGILNFSGKNRRCIFQAVKGSYLFEEGTEWCEDEQRFSKIVFIGKQLDRNELEGNLRKLMINHKDGIFT
jgi:G3E family GTPase